MRVLWVERRRVCVGDGGWLRDKRVNKLKEEGRENIDVSAKSLDSL